MITIRMEVSDIKYIIMLLIVIGLAIADLVTGWIKACVCEELRSSKMRRGGLGKLAEVVVMAAAVGSEIGFSVLGRYYGHELLASVTGELTAFSVFGYIFVMEAVSIIENYARINPKARRIRNIIKKLAIFKEDNDKNE